MYFPPGNFFLDPQRAVSHAIVTHAHADHAVAGSAHVYCSKLTAQLMQLRFGDRAAGSFHVFEEEEDFSVNGVPCRFYAAGHIGGSMMVMWQWNDQHVLFTGDWNHSRCGHLTPCRFPKTDILITEATFASPAIVHPDIETEIKKITECGTQVVAGAYRTGKAQRLSYLMGKYAPQIPVFVHRDVVPVHQVYEKNGVNTGRWKPFSKQQFNKEALALYIVPPQTLPSYYGSREVATTFVTGWKHWHKQCSFITHISDHADWNGLLKMVNETKPSVIYTMHGSGKHFQTHYFASGIDVFEIL
jgi:putative mRNA 3-end processing factor